MECALKIPKNVESIQSRAFFECGMLTSIDLSLADHLSEIGPYSFSMANATGLSIAIAPTVHTIGEYAFDGFKGCVEIDLSGATLLTSIQAHAFSGSAITGTLTIPVNVTTIEEYAFSKCKNLQYVTIGCNVAVFESHSFEGCVSMDGIIDFTKTTTIGIGAFKKCSSLTCSILFGECIHIIGTNAFQGCSKVHEIV